MTILTIYPLSVHQNVSEMRDGVSLHDFRRHDLRIVMTGGPWKILSLELYSPNINSNPII